MRRESHTEDWREARGPLLALALTNLRYWATVAPRVRGELARWRAPAEGIPDSGLRALALGKLDEEGFNAEVAATLATLAPAASWPRTVPAMVALELLFDYLDGRTELPVRDPIAGREALFGSFIATVDQDGSALEHVPGEHADDAYLRALGARVREELRALPRIEVVLELARTAAARCAQAQSRLHAAPTLGDGQLAEWAAAPARANGLGWREYLAGCASSVLAMHALIAAAADRSTSAAGARRLDDTYLAIGAVITMLDSIADERQDLASGQPGFVRLYDSSEELAESLIALIREALRRARSAPHGAHHAMTLAGAIAYYTTDPGAQGRQAQRLSARLRAELYPTIVPALALMRAWRAAKRARVLVRAGTAPVRAGTVPP